MTNFPATAAHAKLDRLRQMAGEADEWMRANPETPVTELLDLERALRRALPKMRKLRAAGVEVESPTMAARIGGMCREMEELLSKENDQ